MEFFWNSEIQKIVQKAQKASENHEKNRKLKKSHQKPSHPNKRPHSPPHHKISTKKMPKQQQVFGSSKTFRQKKKRKVNLVMPKYKHKLSQEKKIENYKKTELVERAPVLHWNTKSYF
jgi:hypothetical protein